MIRNYLLPILVLGLLIILFSNYLQQKEKYEEGYKQGITDYRSEKDRIFKNTDNSPLTKEQIENFEGLKYFTPETRYFLEARFIPITDSADMPVELLLNDSTKTQWYLRTGYLEFDWDDSTYRLTTLQKLMRKSKKQIYLVPFSDGTNGSLTWKGGRYLDFKPRPGMAVRIDFNLAYNPYCAYNQNYRCPVPPLENQLPFPILAGEKRYLAKNDSMDSPEITIPDQHQDPTQY